MYPCKKNKPKARKAWHAMVKARKTTFSNVLQGLLRGSKVIALTATTATIKMTSGSALTFYRRN
jgi:hypothetical protein